MIPIEIRRFLKTRNEPPYVLYATKAVSNEIHECVKQYINYAKASMSIELDEELFTQAERILSQYDWTLEEMTVLFLMWCVTCPDRMQAWWNQRKAVNGNEENSNTIQT